METERIQAGRVSLGNIGPNFIWVMAPGLTLVVDCNDGGRTVTNFAEDVIVWLRGRGKRQGDAPLRPDRLTGRRVLYRDTMGAWDELAHHKGHFTDYVCGSEEDARTGEALCGDVIAALAKQSPQA